MEDLLRELIEKRIIDLKRVIASTYADSDNDERYLRDIERKIEFLKKLKDALFEY
jgi:hypothetical protein